MLAEETGLATVLAEITGHAELELGSYDEGAAVLAELEPMVQTKLLEDCEIDKLLDGSNETELDGDADKELKLSGDELAGIENVENGSTLLGELEGVTEDELGKDWNGSDRTVLLTADEVKETTGEILGLLDGVGIAEDENVIPLDTLETVTAFVWEYDEELDAGCGRTLETKLIEFVE